jgi:hypothetical protein
MPTTTTTATTIINPESAECRAAVLLAMVQALSVKQGYDCIGTEDDRRMLANMGPEERFRALQIEFVALTYRLETREMEIRATRARLDEVSKERTTLQKLSSVDSKREFEEMVITKYMRSHTEEAVEMHTALERDRQKLKNAINSDILQHIPKSQAVTLEDILSHAGVKPKDSSTRTRLHAMLSEHRDAHRFYPISDMQAMVLKINAFTKENSKNFNLVNSTPIQPILPWESTVSSGGKRKHPVDKMWDSALSALDRRRMTNYAAKLLSV